LALLLHKDLEVQLGVAMMLVYPKSLERSLNASFSFSLTETIDDFDISFCVGTIS
jgi:hypothetical protein